MHHHGCPFMAPVEMSGLSSISRTPHSDALSIENARFHVQMFSGKGTNNIVVKTARLHGAALSMHHNASHHHAFPAPDRPPNDPPCSASTATVGGERSPPAPATTPHEPTEEFSRDTAAGRSPFEHRGAGSPDQRPRFLDHRVRPRRSLDPDDRRTPWAAQTGRPDRPSGNLRQCARNVFSAGCRTGPDVESRLGATRRRDHRRRGTRTVCRCGARAGRQSEAVGARRSQPSSTSPRILTSPRSSAVRGFTVCRLVAWVRP